MSCRQFDSSSEVIQTYQQLQARNWPQPMAGDERYEERPLYATSLTYVCLNPLTAVRTPRIAAAIASGYCAFVWQLAGAGAWVDADHYHPLLPGRLLFIRSARPFTFHFHRRYEVFSFNLPWMLLQQRGWQIPHGHCLALEPSMATALSELLLNCYSASVDASPRRAQQLEEQLLAALAQQLQPPQLALVGRRQQQLLRVKQLIEQHGTDEQFSLDWLQDAARLSRRYLFKLFEQEPLSLTAYIQRVRLGRAFARLADERYQHLTIQDIALDCTFKTQAHFSRLFRREFQVSPKMIRKALVEAHRLG